MLTNTEKLAWQILTVAPIMKKRLFRPDFDQGANQLPLSYAQVLATLDIEESMTVTEISERFDIAKPNITPLIDRMIEAGYVKRVRNSTDRRVVHVIILEKGREKVREMVASLTNTVQGWSKAMTEEEIQKVTDAIEEIRSILAKGE
ncbi:MAG: MarR family transcriptional regulator [Clostridia bacterium]|nr:MarR family transcriptional regulator [Clostridia bacterium]MBQ9855337.1 MarR family transcriptional regulator [Clostridia bacterium]